MKEVDEALDLIYQALIYAIDSNSGIGFHNNDQGHPAYQSGAEDGYRNEQELGDSSDQNRLYQMLIALSEQFGESQNSRIQNWREFCQRAYSGYKKHKT